jgi:putative hemolysin
MVSRTRGTAQLFRAPAAAKVPEITLLVIGLAWLVPQHSVSYLTVTRRDIQQPAMLAGPPADHG